MNTIWIARIVLATILMLVSALAIEMVIGWFGRPRRWIWLTSMAAAIALPIVVSIAPDVMPALGIERQGTTSPLEATARKSAKTTPFYAPMVTRPYAVVAETLRFSIVGFIWIVASSLLFVLAITVAARLAVLRNRARPAVADGVPVRLTANLGPLVTGYLRPAILLPVWVMDADESERRLILAHEREHIAGGDHWLVPLGALLVIAMPWNPAVWVLYARLRLAIETDCDARVVAAGADRREYGAALIRVAGSAGPHSVLSPAWSNRARQLEHRVRAMTAAPPRARALRSAVLSVGAVIVVALACDAATPDAAASEVQAGSARQHSIRVKPDAVAESAPVKMHLVAAPSAPRQATGTIRVTGYTRPSMRVRVAFDGPAGRLVVVSARALLRVSSVEVDVVTPAEFRVEGNETYRIVATSLENDGEVEIAGTYPDAEGLPTRGSARGPSPGIRFPGAQRVTEAAQVQSLRKQAREGESAIAEVAQANANMLRTIPAPVRPGQILLDSETGESMIIRVLISGGVTAVNGHQIGAGAREVAVMTPVRVEFRNDESFTVAFVAPNQNALIQASARGMAPNSWGELAGHYQGALVICNRMGQGGGISGYTTGTPLSEACKF